MEKSEHSLGLSAAALKYLAALIMLVDHADMALGIMGNWFPPSDLRFYLLRMAGRMAFPIFAYFVAEGCRRTRNFPHYLRRLGLFALLSQVPFSLAFHTLGGSVILTFFLAALAIYGFQRYSQGETPSPTLAMAAPLAAGAAALLLHSDYGFPGVMLVFALYLCGEDRRRLLRCMAIGLALLYLIYQPLLSVLSLPALVPSLIADCLLQVMPLALLFTAGAEASLLLLARYKGQLGMQNKWFFYLFYPIHLMLLWAVAHFLL